MTATPALGAAPRVVDALLDWYRRHGRHLPWRDTRDPYAILVSEFMLQQTQVDRAAPRWQSWLLQFPTLAALAAAPRAAVIRAWTGMGYNLRAVRLHEIAQQAVERFGGQLPSTRADLLKLKGVGPYTAGAVACFAFGEPVAMVDTNVRRVLGRVFLGQPETGVQMDRQVLALAEAVLPTDRAYAWNQALMDLGAQVCTAGRPACLVCPLVSLCQAAPRMPAWPDERRRRLREQRTTYDAAARRRSESQRVLRGRIIEVLRSLPEEECLTLDDLAARLAASGFDCADHPLEPTVRKLARDGLLLLSDPPVAGAPLRLRLP